jgi:hypothetical protein
MKNIFTYAADAWLRTMALICFCILFGARVQAQGQLEFDKYRNLGLDAEDIHLLDSAKSCYQRAEQVAIMNKDQNREVIILNDLGIVSRKQSDYVACKNYHQKAADIALKNKNTEML